MEVRSQVTADDVTIPTAVTAKTTLGDTSQVAPRPRVGHRRSIPIPAATQSRTRVSAARGTPLSRAQEYRFIRGDVRRLILTAGGLLLLMVILLMVV